MLESSDITSFMVSAVMNKCVFISFGIIKKENSGKVYIAEDLQVWVFPDDTGGTGAYVHIYTNVTRQQIAANERERVATCQ